MAEIPTADWSWINEAAERFEQAWKKGARPRIEDFVAKEPGLRLPPLLNELLRVECELRVKAGERPAAEEYRRRFPEHDNVVASVFAPAPAAAARPLLSSTGRSTTTATGDKVSKLPPDLASHADYEIIRELGHGGMGVVFLAHNRILGRDEVLKVIGPEIIESPGVFDRFLREIRSVAKLQHPNIVTAHAAFRCGESLVFAMEYIDGLDLARMVMAKGPMPARQASYFVHQAALALQNAHEAGMVHRDIKPSNLMLTHKAGKALIKVLDFGLAKASSEQRVQGAVPSGANIDLRWATGLTLPGEMLGTPDFIAPEQIANSQGADIRADIYSLGCTLYFLLSGRPPFQSASMRDTLRAHRTAEAPSLHVVRQEVPPELAAVVARMMAKEPGLRFQAPSEVANVLAPFFKKPTAAAASSNVGVDHGRAALDRAADTGRGMWSSLIDFKVTEDVVDPVANDLDPSRKRPRWLWPAVAAGSLLCGLMGAWVSGVFKSTVDRHSLSVKKNQVETAGEDVGIRTEEKKPIPARREPVFASEPMKTTPSIAKPSSGTEAPTRSSDEMAPVAILREIASIKTSDPVLQAHVLPDARHVLYEIEGKNRELWSGDLTDPRKPVTRKLQLKVPSGWNHLALSSDGRFALLAGKDKSLRRWDLQTGQTIRLRAGTDDVTAIAISPNDQLVAYVRDGAIQLCDALTGRRSKEKEFVGKIGDRTNLLAFTRDGRRIVATHADRAIRVWDVQTGQEIWHADPGKLATSLAVFPDGRRVMTGFSDPLIEIWDLETGRQLRQICNFGSSIAVSADSRRALIGGGTLMRLWDLETCEELVREDHQKVVLHVGLSSDERHAVSCTDESLRVWALSPGRRAGEEPPVVEVAQFLGHPGITTTAIVSPDGRRVLTGGWRNTIRLWNRETGQLIRKFDELGGPIHSVAFSPQGERALSGGDDGVVRLWNLENGEMIREFPGHADFVMSVAFSPNGRLAYSAGGAVYRDGGLHDGTDFGVRVWNVDTAALVRKLEGHKGMVWSMAVSADGRYVLSGGNDGVPILWNAETGDVIHRLRGHTGHVRCVAFLPDGRRAVSSGEDITIRLWDLESGRELSPGFTGHPPANKWLAVSPDGHRLFASDENGRELQLWNVDTGKLIQRINWGEALPTRGSFTPDGRHAVWAGWDGIVRMYRLTETGAADRSAAGSPAASATEKPH